MQTPEFSVLRFKRLHGKSVRDVSAVKLSLQAQHLLLEIAQVVLPPRSAFALVLPNPGEFGEALELLLEWMRP